MATEAVPRPIPSPRKKAEHPFHDRAEAIKLIGGLVVVCIGLLAITIVGVAAMLLLQLSNTEIVALATSSYGVIGTIVAGYFGVKVGTDSKRSQTHPSEERAER